jgi:putative transposase
MLRFRQLKSLQKFASGHASFQNHFASDRNLIDRQTYKLHRSTARPPWPSGNLLRPEDCAPLS